MGCCQICVVTFVLSSSHGALSVAYKVGEDLRPREGFHLCAVAFVLSSREHICRLQLVVNPRGPL